MIYYIIRPLARFACLLYFRKIYLLNADRIPPKGPLLIVCNHPSAFFEACLLAVLLPRSLYFLTRGDFFKNRVFAWFLRQTHQIPIFRSQDGIAKLRNNPETFALCYRALREQKAILMFPEMFTVVEKRLRPLQKGAARLAIGAIDHVPGLSILPIGVTFSDPTKFRSLVTIRCGTPIPVKKLQAPSEEREIVSQMTAHLQETLRTLIIHIEIPEREPLFDALQLLVFNNIPRTLAAAVSTSEEFPMIEQRIASQVNILAENAEAILTEHVAAYQRLLNQHHLTDRFVMTIRRLPNIARSLWLPMSVILLIGKMVIVLPVGFVRKFLQAQSPKRPYYGPIKWVLGFFTMTLWFLLILVAGYILGEKTGLSIAFVLVLIGCVTLQRFHDLDVRGVFAMLMMQRAEKEVLINLRHKIIGNV